MELWIAVIAMIPLQIAAQWVMVTAAGGYGLMVFVDLIVWVEL